MTKPIDRVKSDRQNAIAKLYFKGYGTPALIMPVINKYLKDEDKLTLKEVQHYLKLVKTALNPSTQKSIEYRRAQLRREIQAAQQKAWEFVDGTALGIQLLPKEKIAALRVVVSTVDLRAKIEGVTQEKVIIDDTDKTAQANIDELAKIEKEARKAQLAGVTHEEVKTALPAYLKNGEEDEDEDDAE